MKIGFIGLDRIGDERHHPERERDKAETKR